MDADGSRRTSSVELALFKRQSIFDNLPRGVIVWFYTCFTRKQSDLS